MVDNSQRQSDRKDEDINNILKKWLESKEGHSCTDYLKMMVFIKTKYFFSF